MGARIIYRLISGEPKPGHEFQYYMAWKHRSAYSWLYNKTPFWQFRKKTRRYKKLLQEIRNIHKHGQDKIYGE